MAQTVAKATGVDPETAKKNVLVSIGGLATGRMTTPEEVATLVVMLASPLAANVTGSNYMIDGGLIKTRRFAELRLPLFARRTSSGRSSNSFKSFHSSSATFRQELAVLPVPAFLIP